MKLACIRKLAVVLAVLAMATLGTTRSASAHPEKNLVDEVLDRGKIVLCTSSLAPWAFKNPDTNKWDGFVPELAYQMADEMGVEIDWVELNYGTMIPALLAGKCDVAFGSFVRSAKRAIVVDFTDSHFDFGTFVALRKDDERWTSYEQMNSPDFTFAARPDYSEVITKKYFPNAKVRITQGDNNDLPRLEVRAGRADGAIDDGPTLAAFNAEHDFLKVFDGASLEGNGAAWALRPGTDHMREFLNTFLLSRKELGEYDRLVQKWMDF